MKYLIVALVFIFTGCKTQNTLSNKNTMEQVIANLDNNFEGKVGVYAKNLKTGEEISYNGDSLFPTASTIKVAINAKIFDKIDKGELKYDSIFTIHDSIQWYKGDDGIIASLKDKSTITLSRLQFLSISVSDNAASVWLQHLAGGGIEINKFLEDKGIEKLRMNSRTPGREKDYDLYGWGQTSPKSIANVLVKLRNKELISPLADEEMYRLMRLQYYDNRSLSSIPPYINAISKTGSLNASRCEVFLVNAPSGDYVAAIYTKDNKDQSWGHDNKAVALIQEISWQIWNHFEPNYGWEPQRDKKYKKIW